MDSVCALASRGGDATVPLSGPGLAAGRLVTGLPSPLAPCCQPLTGQAGQRLQVGGRAAAARNTVGWTCLGVAGWVCVTGRRQYPMGIPRRIRIVPAVLAGCGRPVR